MRTLLYGSLFQARNKQHGKESGFIDLDRFKVAGFLQEWHLDHIYMGPSDHTNILWCVFESCRIELFVCKLFGPNIQ